MPQSFLLESHHYQLVCLQEHDLARWKVALNALNSDAKSNRFKDQPTEPHGMTEPHKLDKPQNLGMSVNYPIVP